MCSFPEDVLNDVRRLLVIGKNFGPPASVINDTIGRSVMLQPTDAGGVATGSYSVSNVQMFSWSHTEIKAFTAEPCVPRCTSRLDSFCVCSCVWVWVCGWRRYGAVKVRVRSSPFVAGPVFETTSNSASYADFTPRISALSGGGPGGFNTAGGDVLTMEMFHLGSTQTLSVSVGNSTCRLVTAGGDDIAPADVRRVVIEEPLEGAAPTVDTSWTVRCVVPPGEGLSNPVTVFRNGVPSLPASGGGATLQYAPPSIGRILTAATSGFEPVVDANGIATELKLATSGGRVRLEGSNFGFCPEVRLSIDGAGIVYTLTYCRVDPATNTLVDVTGDATWSEFTVAHDHGWLEFDIPPGQGSAWLLTVATAAQVSVVPLKFGFHPPSITGVTLPGGAPSTAGGASIIVEGMNFGLNPLSPSSPPTVWLNNPALGIGQLDCGDVTRSAGTWHTRVECTLPEGGGASHSVYLQAGDQVGVLAGTISYSAPSLVDVSHARRLVAVAAGDVLTGAAAGGYTITLTGSSMAAAPAGDVDSGVCIVLTSPGTDAPVTAADGSHSGPVSCSQARAMAAASSGIAVVPAASHTHTAVAFVMPPGLGTRSITVLAWGLAAAVPARFAYDAPLVVGLAPANGPTDGGTVVELNGTNFGSPTYAPLQTIQVRFGAVVCSAARTEACAAEERECPCDIVSHSNSIVAFSTPGGIGRDVSVVVEVVEGGDVVALSSAALFHYDPPVPVYTLPYETDAQGMRISIPGRNFGDVADMPAWTAEQRVVKVLVSGVACDNAVRVRQLGQSILECDMPRTTVGVKNLTITVAGQNGVLDADGAFYTVCKPGFYGRPGELCVECPRGGTCDGWQAEPRSIPGWYNLNNTKDACVPERMHRTVCNNLLPCEPKFACTGNNECALGYASKPPMFRCSSCATGYYRRAGECVECPDNPWILAIGFFLGAVGACVVGYVLNAAQVNLAFVSIGIDYFQVLAMFANSRVQWPAIIKDVRGAGTVRGGVGVPVPC